MIKSFILKTIKLYQVFVSPGLGRHCRFKPSCSDYFCRALEKYGAAKGLEKGFRRILKCNPFSRGGTDEP